MRIVSSVLLRYGCKSKTSQTMGMHSSCIVFYLCSAPVDDYEQYAKGLIVVTCCACNNTRPIWNLDASKTKVMCPVEFGSAKTGGDTSAPFRKFMDFIYLSMKDSNVFAWSFHNLWFRGAAIQVKFCKESTNDITNSKERVKFRLVDGSFDPMMAFVVWDAI